MKLFRRSLILEIGQVHVELLLREVPLGVGPDWRPFSACLAARRFASSSRRASSSVASFSLPSCSRTRLRTYPGSSKKRRTPVHTRTSSQPSRKAACAAARAEGVGPACVARVVVERLAPSGSRVPRARSAALDEPPEQDRGSSSGWGSVCSL